MKNMFDANEIFSSVDLMNLSNLQRQNVSTLASQVILMLKKYLWIISPGMAT